MKRTLILSFLALFFYSQAYSQLIDGFGLTFGAGLSNQYWDYQNANFNGIGGWKSNKAGVNGQFYVEKYMNSNFSFRPSIGYIQKGFTEETILLINEPENISVKDKRIIEHMLSLDLPFKVVASNFDMKPYFLLGLRMNYLLDARGILMDYNGEEIELNTDLYDDFRKFTLGTLFGAGISYKDIFFIEIKFNPAITHNFDSALLSIHDRYFGVTAGFNVQSLLQ